MNTQTHTKTNTDIYIYIYRYNYKQHEDIYKYRHAYKHAIFINAYKNMQFHSTMWNCTVIYSCIFSYIDIFIRVSITNMIISSEINRSIINLH